MCIVCGARFIRRFQERIITYSRYKQKAKKNTNNERKNRAHKIEPATAKQEKKPTLKNKMRLKKNLIFCCFGSRCLHVRDIHMLIFIGNVFLIFSLPFSHHHRLLFFLFNFFLLCTLCLFSVCCVCLCFYAFILFTLIEFHFVSNKSGKMYAQ